MKTFREIAEIHYASEPSNEFDKQYRLNRINALEKLLTEQLTIPAVVGQSEQLPLSKCCNSKMKSMRYCTKCQEWEGGN